MNEVKTCRCCGISKSYSEFYNKRNDCKKCAIDRSTRNSISYVPLHERDIISRFKNLCTKAKKRTKDFSIISSDLSDLWEKQNGRCAYTKLPLLATANQFNTVSLDRVDSSKGYVVGNIQLVCAAINKMKQEYTEEMFLLFCLLVTQNNKLSESPESLLARYVPLGIVNK
jgi:hypothetical protein